MMTSCVTIGGSVTLPSTQTAIDWAPGNPSMNLHALSMYADDYLRRLWGFYNSNNDNAMLPHYPTFQNQLKIVVTRHSPVSTCEFARI